MTEDERADAMRAIELISHVGVQHPEVVDQLAQAQQIIVSVVDTSTLRLERVRDVVFRMTKKNKLTHTAWLRNVLEYWGEQFEKAING